MLGTRATASVSTPPPNRPRPYNDYGGGVRSFIVGAGEEGMRGGDPCGRPRTSPMIGIIPNRDTNYAETRCSEITRITLTKGSGLYRCGLAALLRSGRRRRSRYA